MMPSTKEAQVGAIKTGANGLGKFLMGIGFVGGGANFAPPSAFITAFVADAALGILGVASIAAILRSAGP